MYLSSTAIPLGFVWPVKRGSGPPAYHVEAAVGDRWRVPQDAVHDVIVKCLCSMHMYHRQPNRSDMTELLMHQGSWSTAVCRLENAKDALSREDIHIVVGQSHRACAIVRHAYDSRRAARYRRREDVIARCPEKFRLCGPARCAGVGPFGDPRRRVDPIFSYLLGDLAPSLPALGEARRLRQRQGGDGLRDRVHRAGASLNVHVHFHVLCLDGVYIDDGEASDA